MSKRKDRERCKSGLNYRSGVLIGAAPILPQLKLITKLTNTITQQEPDSNLVKQTFWNWVKNLFRRLKCMMFRS